MKRFSLFLLLVLVFSGALWAADEIRVSGRIEHVARRQIRDFGVAGIDQATDRVYGNTQNIGTSEETLAWPADITTEGYAYLQNTDDTNYVQVGFATGVYGMRLLPGEWALFPVDPGMSTLYAKSDTGACDLDYAIFSR